MTIDSVEVIKSNATTLLNLKYNTSIQYILVHLHLYAHSLEWIEKTSGKSLFKAMVSNQKNGIGISNVDSYSSQIGIPVFLDHEYQLISTYLNLEKQKDITAMAIMFLYLREGEWRNLLHLE